MPTEQTKSLRGLPGLNSISEQERQAFMLNNADKLKQYRSPGKRKQAAEILYNNQQFINTFGQEEFDKMNNGTRASYDYRNELLKNKVIDNAFKEAYSPFDANGKRDNNKGFGKDWEKYYNDLSVDAKEELLRSDWKTPEQLKKEQDERTSWWEKGIDFVAGEAIQQYKKDSNQKILDRIYNNAADNAAKSYSSQISQAYLDPEITGRNDTDTKQKFIKAITPDYANGNMGIAEYASHYGNGTESDITSEMDEFSIDDMRQVLAKKAVYDATMSPEMAATALNNEAKRYIKQHQGSLKRFGLFAKDVGISALSYTADKVNSLYNLGLMAADRFGDKPTVYVDDRGTILDLNKVRLVRGRDGIIRYQDENGETHSVHQQEISRTTLHNMGKNMDGSDDDSILNPEYWTRAEQFGTLDEDLQKQYEKLGSSPYKVAYNPNDETDLAYESFKMMSFGIADAASMLIPFGIGAAGKALSTASKVGKIGRGFGNALNKTGRALTFETKTGRVSQGLVGAGGIAYAYQRGAFQETLAQNLANAEESLKNASQKDIYNQYQNDEDYRQQVDSLINARAATMKADYIASMGRDNGNQIADEEALDRMIHDRAQTAVLGELTQKRMDERRNSKEFAQLQEEAINSAGDAAIATFLPEAIKYGLVNTVGFRNFLYSNPSSLVKRASKNFAGLTEKTLENGAKRMDVASRFATVGDKMKQLGKVAAAQAWGGAWTNGTDDMMVDAAERFNQDSFQRYLNAFETGETIADTYGLAEFMYSYWRGLQNSVGQETTWNAAIVGGAGSIVSASPNMANIAHLATKEGRQAFKDNLTKRPVFENGKIQRDEQGNPVMEDISWENNLLERANYFIQNGVLNNYYGKRASERELQVHADYINQLLDREEDFKVLGELVASDMGLVKIDLNGKGDEKTARYIKALDTMIALDRLGRDAYDPTTLSSKVMESKSLIERAARLGTDQQKEDDFSEEELNSLIGQYYSQHKGLEQSDENNQLALQHIQKNAQELQEAFEAYNRAGEEIKKIEKNQGTSIDEAVKRRLQKLLALNGHWEDRLASMKDAIGDASVEGEVSIENLVPSVGGKKSAEALVKAYDKQEKELNNKMDEQLKRTEEIRKEYQDAQKARKKAVTSDEILKTQTALDLAKAKYEDSQMQEKHLDDLVTKTKAKRSRVKQALDSIDKDAESKILTVDEIFALDPVTRAHMLNPSNRSLYSKEQITEIEKLEAELKSKDADALQKIQDISLLTQRIATNKNAYHKISENPTAAAIQFESQIAQAADAAYKLINQRNAETLVDYIAQFEEGTKGHEDITQELKENAVYRILRQSSSSMLDIIDKNNMLPQWQKQVNDAKEWTKVTEDIDSVIDHLEGSKEWKKNLRDAISNVIDTANDKAGIMANLEKVIDDVEHPQAVQDFEKVLKGLEKLSYQRDATVIEERAKRKEREEAAKKKIEEEEKKAKEAADAAAKKAADDSAKAEAARKAAEEEEKSNAAPAQEVKADGSNLVSSDTAAPDMSKAELIPGSEEDVSWDDIASMLMDEGAEDGTIEMGEMWYKSNGQWKKGVLKVSLKTGEKFDNSQKTISFHIDSDGTAITVYPGDAVFPKESKIAITQQQADERELTDEFLFNVNDIKKINGEWYFSGTFVDYNGESKSSIGPSLIKVKDSFDLDNAIKRHMSTQEAIAVSEGVEVSNPHLVEDGDYVHAESPTIEEQAKEEGVDNLTTEENDVNDLNESVEKSNDIRVNSLSGNVMSTYQYDSLSNDGVLIRKTGNRGESDSRNRYNNWMDSFVDSNGVTGTKVQNIVDTELHQILSQNPHTKVKFMAVRPDHNATNDYYMQSHLMLVIDYTDDVADIHKKENGGVIESEGKKYLIIGTAGYGNINTANGEQRAINEAKRDLYDILFAQNKEASATKDYGILIKERKKFFDSHNGENGTTYERFYVHPTFETEIVPGSLVPGYLVKQMEEDTTSDNHRAITKLLNDPEVNRNPDGLTLDDLKWGIQEVTKFLPIKERVENIMVPRNSLSNSGAAFVLIPASNGKMLPVHIDPLRWVEMNNGALKDRVTDLLTRLTAPGTQNYATRYSALEQLLQIFYFDKEGNNILLGKKGRNTIGLVKEGNTKPFVEFHLDSNFDFEEFQKAFAEMNPRVNITRSVLTDRVLLKQYAEAGALNTDCAFLHTVGSSYNIYAIDAQGNMLDSISKSQPQRDSDSDFRNDKYVQVYFNGSPYQYNNSKGEYTLNGNTVTDADTLKQLDYNRRVAIGELTPSMSSTLWDYYVLSTGEHPQVIKIHKNSRAVVEATEEEATKFVQKLIDDAAAKEREAAAQKAMKESLQGGARNTEDVNLGIEETQGEKAVESQQNPVENEQQSPEEKEKKEEAPAEQQKHDRDYYADKSVEGRTKYQATSATQDVETLTKNRKYKYNIFKLLSDKWEDSPVKVDENGVITKSASRAEIREFLKNKGIEVDAIGTSEADIQSWMKIIRECR